MLIYLTKPLSFHLIQIGIIFRSKKLPPEAIRPRIEIHFKLLQTARSLSCFDNDVDAAMQFALQYLSHSDEKVRKSCARLFLEVYRIARATGLTVTEAHMKGAAGTQMSKPILTAVAKLDKDNGWSAVYVVEEEGKAPAATSALPPVGAR